MATNNDIDQSSISPGLTVFGYCVGFAIPLTILYNIFYHKRGGIGSLILLFVGAYFMGFLFTLLYYRAVVMHQSADIAKIDSSTVKKVMGVNVASFSIVGITLFAITINPSLVHIFENTIGYTLLGLKGLHELASEIFVSKELDEIQKAGDFNYDFLITRFGVNDIDAINKYFENGCTQQAGQTNPLNLPTYFEMNIKDDGQLFNFTNLIYLKHSVGHFTWIYLTSIIAMLISMITLAMK